VSAPPLPEGFRIVLDGATRQLAHDLWTGGSPRRVLRLTDRGQAAWRELSEGPVATRAGAALARRLTDTGLAHPMPPATVDVDATVVIPVRDRAALLSRSLAALGGRYPVVVVDDGSRDPTAVAAVASRYGATLVRRPRNGGPAAARNAGLAAVRSELVAFVDSDCATSPQWIDQLAGHFADPAVAAVAPRVVPLATDAFAGRYTRATCSLDLGVRPARVAPNTRVFYVPTAALLTRRSALEAVANAGEVFDRTMPVGEDVDLVWRLHDHGWRIRYDPSVQVGHHEPRTWRGLLFRRLRYGTSVAPLSDRHPGYLTHLVLDTRPTPSAVLRTWIGAGRYATRFGMPLLLALALPGGRTRWLRRVAVGSLVLASPLAAWTRQRPILDPVRYTVATLADDIAYGAGVWAGCAARLTTAPLRPVLIRHPPTKP
jgi:mycofactocin system glycosyltransferase